MKRFLLFPLLLLTACTNTPSGTDYSFDFADTVKTFTLEKTDHEASEYRDARCTRDGLIQWDLTIEPEDFTGSVIFRGKEFIDGIEVGGAVITVIPVVNGEMLPQDFYMYQDTDDLVKFGAVCSFTEASQLRWSIDKSTLVMIPGFNPPLPEDSDENNDSKEE